MAAPLQVEDLSEGQWRGFALSSASLPRMAMNCVDVQLRIMRTPQMGASLRFDLA